MMLKRLTNSLEAAEAVLLIKEITDAHAEWLYAQKGGAHLSLRRSELDFHIAHERLIFSCTGERGAEVWRVNAWAWDGSKLLLEASRRSGREHARLELIPRISVSALHEELSASRRVRCAKLAELVLKEATPGTVIERASLSTGARSKHPGSFVRILLKQRRERIAVTGTVTESQPHDVDAFLSSSIIWFERLRERARPPYIQKLWLVAAARCIETARQRIALLRDDIARRITLYEIDEAYETLAEVGLQSLEELLNQRPPRLRLPSVEKAMTASAARIIALAPHAIDVVRARRGETLRFHGLPFARVRRALASERVWFGLAGPRRRLLDHSNEREFEKLLSDLIEHRGPCASDHNHALYKRAPEAWLESILRRDITRLDTNLRLAPLHAQFRASQTETATSTRAVDLLALRRDGRLVVIELKVREDREHVLQGADYWRRVELHRRSGHLTRAQLFGDATIADSTPLVYLVAPLFSFHRSYQTLARAIAPDIEIHRFDLNEDWRTGVRVMRVS